MAYRRPADQATLNSLMDFYKRGRSQGTFESGIESALQFVLAIPAFLFRIEPDPSNIAANTAYRIDDYALASPLIVLSLEHDSR
jgi:hypothetical protein